MLLTLKLSTFLQRTLRFKEITSSKNPQRIPLKTSLNLKLIQRTSILQIQWLRLVISSTCYFQIINVRHSLINLNMHNIKKQSEIKMTAQHQLENETQLNTTDLWLEDLKRTLDQEAWETLESNQQCAMKRAESHPKTLPSTLKSLLTFIEEALAKVKIQTQLSVSHHS